MNDTPDPSIVWQPEPPLPTEPGYWLAEDTHLVVELLNRPAGQWVDAGDRHYLTPADIAALGTLRPLVIADTGDIADAAVGVDTSPAEPRVRDDVLTTAQQLISGDREATYGDAVTSFDRIATMWTAILDQPVNGSDVARCMVALKLSRLHANPQHRDSWIDIAGYAALGAEIGSHQ